MSSIHASSKFAEKIFDQLSTIQGEARGLTEKVDDAFSEKSSQSFTDHLKENFHEVNHKHTVADKMASDIASGKSTNIHETMLAATEAELSFNLMVQIRNKALEAYNEIMRMPV